MILPYLEINQPIGSFYLTRMKASELIEKTDVIRRVDTLNGVQRELSRRRVNEIAHYCDEPEAIFPTAIIVSVYDSDAFTFHDDHAFEVSDNISKIGEIIDGQHRIEGIMKNGSFGSFDLPVVLLFDLDPEDKAYIFSIINSKQTQVSSSLIYDLFEFTSYRSPQKLVHQIARSFNETPESPLYGRIKMLGKKTKDQEFAVLSQGSFGSFVIGLITHDPNSDLNKSKSGLPLSPDPTCPLRQYYIDEEDDVIQKILINYFSALKTVFPKEWENPKDNILWKTSGFGGVIKAFPELYRKGCELGDLSQAFFENCFSVFSDRLKDQNKTLTKEDFPGGGAGIQNKIRDLIVG